MTHVVTSLRTAVRAALITALPDYTVALDYWRRVDPGQLPRAGVGTPRVLTQRIDADFVERTADLAVIVKLEGDETLEEVLDGLSETVETAVLPVLETLSDDFDLVETLTECDAEGQKSIGTLSMLFRVVLRTSEGNPD